MNLYNIWHFIKGHFPKLSETIKSIYYKFKDKTLIYFIINNCIKLLTLHNGDVKNIIRVDKVWLNNSFESNGEVIVFIVKEWAASEKKIKVITDILRNVNISIMKICKFDDKQKQIASNYICKNYPSLMIIAFDYNPIPLDAKYQKLFPFVSNQNVVLARQTIQNYFNDRMLRIKSVDCIHSSNNEIEAFEYIKYLSPNSCNEIQKQIELYRNLYKTKFKILKIMPKIKSKIELIEYKGKLAIKKTFKYGNERFLGREIFVYSKLSQKYEFIPPLLETSGNYFIIPYYKSILEPYDYRDMRYKRIIKKYAIQIVKVIYSFYQEGYALLDFNTGSILITEDGDLKIIDFEHLYKYDNKPDKFQESYDIKGYPKNIITDLPERFSKRTYKNAWQPILGRKLEDILAELKL